MKKIILGVVGILVILVAILLLQSAPIDPAAYTPPKAPQLTGVLAPNNLLQKSELLAQGKINGPEEVAVDSQGRVYGGTQDGKILRLLPDGKLEVFAETKGRPLGLQFDKNENLKSVSFQNLSNTENWQRTIELNKEGHVSCYIDKIQGVIRQSLCMMYHMNDPGAEYPVETITTVFEEDGISYFQKNNTTGLSRTRDRMTLEWSAWR